MTLPVSGQDTRQNLLGLLKQHGPTDARTLAGRLGITPMAARQHLYALRDENLATYDEQARPLGRPAKIWRLLPAADALFPTAYRELAQSILEAAGDAFGNNGIEEVLGARTHRQIENYARVIAGATTLPARLEALASQRSAEGYMALVEEGADGECLFIENHCPICQLAKACTGLCNSELEVFRTVLGPDVDIDRTEHIVAGARRCAYRVKPRIEPQRRKGEKREVRNE